jgi:hypothetical protein
MTIKGMRFESNDKYKARETARVLEHHDGFSANIFFLSVIFNPKAKTIFRFVSDLHDIPFSIRVMVRGEILALLESSALLIIKDSLIFLRLFLLICFDSASQGVMISATYLLHCRSHAKKPIGCINHKYQMVK